MIHLKSFALFENLNKRQVDFYIEKFSDKMEGSTLSTSAWWIDGIGELSDEEKQAVWIEIQEYIDKDTKGDVELPLWLSEEHQGDEFDMPSILKLAEGADTMMVLVTKRVLGRMKTHQGAKWYALDVEDLKSKQETIQEESVFGSDEDGEEEEIYYKDIQEVNVDGKRMSAEDLK